MLRAISIPAEEPRRIKFCTAIEEGSVNAVYWSLLLAAAALQKGKELPKEELAKERQDKRAERQNKKQNFSQK